MASRTNSTSDLVFTDGELSPRLQQLYSPMSNYSTQSQEMLNSVFESDYSTPNNQYDDYSHIQYPPNRKLSAPVVPEPPLRTSSVSSFMSDYTHRSYTTGHGNNHNHGNIHGNNYGNSYNHSNSNNGGATRYYNGQPHQHNQHLHPPSRRKTWTPSGLKMGITGNVNSGNGTNHVRNCHSNDPLENNFDSIINGHIGGHIVIDDPEIAPPRLAPVSGILPRSPARGIIKPIAFKPVVVNHNYVNTRRMVDNRKYSLQDDGYGSQDYPMTNQRNAANMSHSSLHMESDRSASFSSDGQSNKHFSPDRPESIRSFQMDSEHSTSFSSDSQKQYTPERSESIPSSNMSRVSATRLEGYVQTPSPSDSGVGELEAMLKEKDAEINTLRDVMEKNEKAIFQVYEEKKKSWSQDLKQLKDEYDQKFKVLQRKSYKTEQVLSLQVYKLQQEKKNLKEECDKIKVENDELKKKIQSCVQETERLESQMADISSHSHSVSEENVDELQMTVDSLNDSLRLKAEETMELRKELENKQQELNEKDEEIGEKFREIVARTDEVQSLKETLRRLSVESSMETDKLCNCDKDSKSAGKSPKSPNCDRVMSPANSSMAGDNAQEEIQRLREEIEAHNERLEKEREQWADEKNKVIRYQKQLQLNYVQMYRKNKLLEAEVEQLTLELESRDIKLMSINGEESVC